MQILAHRGYWSKDIQGNSPEAIKQALKNRFGFESDIRDYKGKLVISHNIADSCAWPAEEAFRWLAELQDDYCFAINIKADGLKDILLELLKKYNIKNYFLFDMSVPQMIEFDEAGLRFFTRQSEVEPEPVMYKKATGVWIDSFWKTDWITAELLQKHINNRKSIGIVSPELHGRTDYLTFWRKLREFSINFDKVLLCTDYPDEARRFFGRK